MDFLIHIDAISMGLTIVYFKGPQVDYSKWGGGVLMSLDLVLILANSAEPGEMKHYAAFHLGLHCLSA